MAGDTFHGETAEYWWNRYVEANWERTQLQQSVDYMRPIVARVRAEQIEKARRERYFAARAQEIF